MLKKSGKKVRRMLKRKKVRGTKRKRKRKSRRIRKRFNSPRDKNRKRTYPIMTSKKYHRP